MITFKAIIVPNNRRKDGTYPVKIRVTFKGVVRRLATTMVCSPSDLTRSLKIKSPDILNKSDELINRMRKAVADISPFDLENKDVDWVVNRIKTKLSGEAFHLDFFEWADEFLQTKKKETKDVYTSSLNSFALFLGERKVDINAINKTLLQDYADFVEKQPWMRYDKKSGKLTPSSRKKKKGSSTGHLSRLGHIYNAAKDKYNDEDSENIRIPKSPFSKIETTKRMHQGQRNIGVDTMQRLISYETNKASLRTAIDIFVVSFGLMGANLADLYEAKPVKGDVWIYNRKKTRDRRQDKAEMRVEIPVELQPFIERLRGNGGKWLNVIHDYSTDIHTITYKVNYHLKRWCKVNDLQPFTLYANRHTWASIARTECGIDKSTIDDCLVHVGQFQVADIYAEKGWRLMQDANRKVLDLFEWDVTENG